MRRILDTVKHGAIRAFLSIEEPRVIRLFQFGIYLMMAVLGFAALLDSGNAIEAILGDVLAINLEAAITVGGVVGSIAVLPGIWWAERLAIISLISGLLMFLIVSLALVVSVIGVCVSVALILSLGIRWLHVRKYQFAPGK